MSQPTPYVRQANFTDHTQNLPDVPQDGTQMDAEFNAVKTTLDQTLVNLSLLQRDDGGLRPGIVDRASLSDTLVLGFEKPAISWYTATAYEPGNEVWVSSKLYVCNIAHTSTVFATDLAALRWTLILDASPAMIGIITADAQAAQAGAEAAEDAAIAAAAGISALVSSAANYWAGTAGGTANALVLTTTPVMAAYVPGHKIRFLTGASVNTTAVTVNTSNGLGSRTLRKTIGSAAPLVNLAHGDLPPNTIAEIEYISDVAGYQLINVRPHALGTDVASAGTVTLDTTTGDYIGITGTTTINSVVLARGQERICRAAGAFTLAHSASLILPGAANIIATVGDVFTLRGEAGAVRVTSYLRSSGLSVSADPFLAAQADRVLRGLGLSNNTTDAADDLDIAAGACVSDDGTTLMTLPMNITIETDAVFDGTGNKGLDAGVAANDTYHVWLVMNPTTGIVRAIVSLSVSSPTLFTGFTKKKCIGSIMRKTAAIVPFFQTGNRFYLATAQVEFNAQNPGTSAVTRALAYIPTGLKLNALVTAALYTGSGATSMYLSSLDSVDQVVQSVGGTGLTLPATASGAGTANWFFGETMVCTDTTSRIRSRMSVSGGNDRIGAITRGWLDHRIT